MVDEQTNRSLDYAWKQQRVWSQTADKLKMGIGRGRTAALWLGIIAALLAVVAVQLGTDSAGARWFGLAAGIAAAMVPFAQRQATTKRISAWTRARSVSEGLKTAVYEYLAGAPPYGGDDRDRQLGDEARTIVAAVGDLERETIGISPDAKQPRPVHDVDTYVAERVDEQIGWYTRKAAHYNTVASRLRLVGDGLAAIAAVLGVAAAALDQSSLAAWVPFVTTVGSSLLAHVAASRYDHMIIEYSRTAQQLEHLRDARADDGMSNGDFINACEAVISVENQGWMTRWTESPN